MGRAHARAETEPDLVSLILRGLRRRKQHRRHDAQIVNDRGARFAHARPPGRGMKPVQRDQASAGEQHAHGRVGHGVHVTRRQRREQALGAGPDLAKSADARVPAARPGRNIRSAARIPWAGRWCRRCRAARIRPSVSTASSADAAASIRGSFAAPAAMSASVTTATLRPRCAQLRQVRSAFWARSP